MGGEVAGGVLPWLAGCCGGDRWWRTEGAAGQRRVRPAGRAAAARNPSCRAREGGGRRQGRGGRGRRGRGRGRRGTVREVVGDGGRSGARTAGDDG